MTTEERQKLIDKNAQLCADNKRLKAELAELRADVDRLNEIIRLEEDWARQNNEAVSLAEELFTENKRLRAALEFFADPCNHIYDDYADPAPWTIAQNALDGEKGA